MNPIEGALRALTWLAVLGVFALGYGAYRLICWLAG